MSLDQGKGKRKSFNNIRGVMGMSMGVIYIVIACCVVYFERIHQIDIGETFSYIVAGLMAAYGIFRIYRGFKQMRGDY